MNAAQMLDQYSPVEARAAGEPRLLEWLFVVQQVVAAFILAGDIIGFLPPERTESVLHLISQDGPALLLAVLLFLHPAVLILFFLLRRSLGFYLIVGWLAGMALYSLVEIILGGTTIYHIIGTLLAGFWLMYFLFSSRIKIRFFYDEVFERTVHTIRCPHCKREVRLDAERCGDELSEDERFAALCERVEDVKLPQAVRAAVIELLDERFGERALEFLSGQYEKQLKSRYPVAVLASTLSKILARRRSPKEG